MKKKFDWQNLKSGSDIRGVAVGENTNLTNDVVKSIAISFSVFLEKTMGIKRENQTIAVGHDSRLSNMRIKDIVVNSLSSIGVNVYYCGLSSTPAISMAPKILSCCSAIEITASHHPKEYNGFKFFTLEGGLKSYNIEEILKIACNEYFPKSSVLGEVRNVNLMSKYTSVLKNMVTKEFGSKNPLEGLKIVVDASNGAGGFFAKNFLKKLGADISGSALLEPDGNFPVHSPNPEKKESINFISQLTRENKADLGIIFDADVDRCFFVDNQGNPIVKNKLIALVSKMVLNEHLDSAIVTDSVTSDHLKEFIEKNGGYHIREKRGYQNVIGTAKYLNEDKKRCFLAIETSGHAAFEENEFKDDGAYLAVKVIIEIVKLKKRGLNLFDEISEFQEAQESEELRIPMDNSQQIEATISKFKENYKKIRGCEIDENTPEGVRLNFKLKDQQGWCLLRQSAHDLSIVLNIESDIHGGIEKILQDISVINVDK